MLRRVMSPKGTLVLETLTEVVGLVVWDLLSSAPEDIEPAEEANRSLPAAPKGTSSCFLSLSLILTRPCFRWNSSNSTGLKDGCFFFFFFFAFIVTCGSRSRPWSLVNPNSYQAQPPSLEY